jgi:hypothetical protein
LVPLFLAKIFIGSRLCPPGLEGTTYAVFTAIFNIAYYFSTMFGSALTWWYNVTSKNFDNLATLIIIQTGYSIVFGCMLFFIRFPDDGSEGKAQCQLPKGAPEGDKLFSPMSDSYSTVPDKESLVSYDSTQCEEPHAAIAKSPHEGENHNSASSLEI